MTDDAIRKQILYVETSKRGGIFGIHEMFEQVTKNIHFYFMIYIVLTNQINRFF